MGYWNTRGVTRAPMGLNEHPWVTGAPMGLNEHPWVTRAPMGLNEHPWVTRAPMGLNEHPWGYQSTHGVIGAPVCSFHWEASSLCLYISIHSLLHIKITIPLT